MSVLRVPVVGVTFGISYLRVHGYIQYRKI